MISFFTNLYLMISHLMGERRRGTVARYSGKWVIFPDVVRSVIVKQSVVNIVMRSGIMGDGCSQNYPNTKRECSCIFNGPSWEKEGKRELNMATSSPTHNSTGTYEDVGKAMEYWKKDWNKVGADESMYANYTT